MGAHAFPSPVRPLSSPPLLFVILCFSGLLYAGKPVSGLTEVDSLLKFRSSLNHNEAIPTWNPLTPPCTGGNTSRWLGVICHNGKVWGLKLENMGLSGNIDLDALSQLSDIRAISLRNNEFGGSLPDLRRIPKLRLIYLSNNHFSGDIPDDAFSGLTALRRVILANNAFTGKIPSSLTTLPILVELRLDGNQFQGSIPNFQQKDLPTVNVANNQLEGPLPSSLTNQDPKYFSGNMEFPLFSLWIVWFDNGMELLAYAFDSLSCCLFDYERQHSCLQNEWSPTLQLYLQLVGREVVLQHADFCTVYVISKTKISSVRNASRPIPYPSPLQSHLDSIVKEKPNGATVADTPPRRSVSIKGGPSLKPQRDERDIGRSDRLTERLLFNDFPADMDTDISFVSSDRTSVDRLSPLHYDFMDPRTPRLSTSSDHSFGSLRFGPRMSDASSLHDVSFISQDSGRTSASSHSNTVQVEVLSCIRHPNLVLLLGACPEYGCLVYEYMASGSLDDRLLRRGNTPPLSWQVRFRISSEVATALHFLHQTKPEPLVHRDLKPGNILLDRYFVSKISDVGLARLVPSSVADHITQYHMTSTAGTFCYIDPEYQQTGMLGVKSDVYSLGIVLLQILTDWPVEEALSLAKIALQCAELRRKDRPDLGQTLPELARLRDFADDRMQPFMFYATGNPSHFPLLFLSSNLLYGTAGET